MTASRASRCRFSASPARTSSIRSIASAQALPALEASIPAGNQVAVTMDRTVTIRSSVREIERTLLISIGLVILVVFVFLRNPRATLIPSVAVPVSLMGTFGVMYLWDYSIDNLSLMALTISYGLRGRRRDCGD